jgi:hypothetical protein
MGREGVKTMTKDVANKAEINPTNTIKDILILLLVFGFGADC